MKGDFVPKGKINSPRSIARKLSNSRLFLDNALSDAEIGRFLSAFGTHKAKLTAGQKILLEAENIANEFDWTYGRQFTITKKLENKWDAADEKFAVTRQVARILLGKDAGEKKALALAGERPQALPVWIHQAKTLYQNISILNRLKLPDETYDKIIFIEWLY